MLTRRGSLYYLVPDDVEDFSNIDWRREEQIRRVKKAKVTTNPDIATHYLV